MVESSSTFEEEIVTTQTDTKQQQQIQSRVRVPSLEFQSGIHGKACKIFRVELNAQPSLQDRIALGEINSHFLKVTSKPIHKKKPMQISACEHFDRRHYSRGYCKPCYERIGKQMVAVKKSQQLVCRHVGKGRQVYAKGKCHSCHSRLYRLKKDNPDLSEVRAMHKLLTTGRGEKSIDEPPLKENTVEILSDELTKLFSQLDIKKQKQQRTETLEDSKDTQKLLVAQNESIIHNTYKDPQPQWRIPLLSPSDLAKLRRQHVQANMNLIESTLLEQFFDSRSLDDLLDKMQFFAACMQMDVDTCLKNYFQFSPKNWQVKTRVTDVAVNIESYQSMSYQENWLIAHAKVDEVIDSWLEMGISRDQIYDPATNEEDREILREHYDFVIADARVLLVQFGATLAALLKKRMKSSA